MQPTTVTSGLEAKIEESISRGISFLKNSQFSSGEFPTYYANSPDMKICQYIKTISVTLLIADSLKHVTDYPRTKEMISKSTDFLLSEKENEFTWRFFGKDSKIVPDLDDTCYALAVLNENNVPLDYEKIADRLMNYRNSSGLFYTWFPEKGNKNNTDWVTNTNVLYFFNTIMRKPPIEVSTYLRNIITEKRFVNGSLYYHNPYSFIYFFTRLYSESNFETFDSSMPLIYDFLLSNFKGTADEPISHSVLPVVALLNGGVSNRSLLEKGINVILSSQQKDGGFPIDSIFRHRSYERYYGSRGLFTALATEALSKYKKFFSARFN